MNTEDPNIDTSKLSDRKEALRRHDLDSALFQDRYSTTQNGKYTDEFIYGRMQILEEIQADLKLLPAKSKILDIGAGTGHLSRLMSSPTRSVIGLEPSEKMRALAQINFPDVDFIDGISSRLPFEANTFDYIISIEVLRYLHKDDIAQTYREIFRVLKPDGRFLLTHVNRYSLDGYFLYYYTIKLFKRLLGYPYHNCHFTSCAAEMRAARQAGFKSPSGCGRMLASVRIGYKFGKLCGTAYAKFLELFNVEQRYTRGFGLNTSGHLILRGSK